MTITVESLWYIYAFSFLIFALLFYLIGSRMQSSTNAAASFFFASIIAALLVMVLSKIYIQPTTLNQQQKQSFDALIWISWGLVVIFFFWYIFSLSGSRKVVKSAEVFCDNDGDCVIIEKTGEGTYVETIKTQNSPRIVSPVGNFEIKYLV